MIKTKDKFFMSFGSELKLIYNELKTTQKGKTLQNRGKPNFKLFVILKSPEFLKGPNFIATVIKFPYSSPDGCKR